MYREVPCVILLAWIRNSTSLNYVGSSSVPVWARRLHLINNQIGALERNLANRQIEFPLPLPGNALHNAFLFDYPMRFGAVITELIRGCYQQKMKGNTMR